MAKAQYIQGIEIAIEDIRAHIEKSGQRIGGNGRELQTRYWIIDPIIKALGWDVSNPEQVWIEFPTNDQFADYAFFPRNTNTPVMVIEAKSVREKEIDPSGMYDEEWDEVDEDDEEWDEEQWLLEESLRYWRPTEIDQLRFQTRDLNQGYGVLTSGNTWSIFDLSKKGNSRTANTFQRRAEIHHFSILFSPLDECIDGLKKLHRRNLLKAAREQAM